jgi:PAS domain S-box-containing protein
MPINPVDKNWPEWKDPSPEDGQDTLRRTAAIAIRLLRGHTLMIAYEGQGDRPSVVCEGRRLPGYLVEVLSDRGAWHAGHLIARDDELLPAGVLALDDGTRIVAHSPLRVGDSICGALWVFADASWREQDGDESALIDIAHLASGELSRLAQRRSLEVMHRRLEGKNHLLELMAGGVSMDDTLLAVSRYLENETGSQVAIHLLDGSEKQFSLVVAPSLPAEYADIVHGSSSGNYSSACRAAISHRRPILVSDILDDPLMLNLRTFATRHGYRAYWSFPVVRPDGEGVFGTIAILDRSPGSPSRVVLRLLAVAASLAGIAVERERVQAALQESQERLVLAMESARESVWDWDLASNTVQFNDYWATRLGYDPAGLALNYDKWVELLHPEDRADTVRLLQKHLDGGTPRYAAEYRLRMRDGSWLWVQDRGQVVRRDADGSPLRMVGIQIDVNDRRVAEDALRMSELFARRILEATPDCVQVLDRAGRLVSVNRAGQRLLDIEDFRAVSGRDWKMFWPEDRHSIVSEALERALAEGSSEFEAGAPTLKGVQRWWHVIVTSLISPAGQTLLLTVWREMSRQKRIEADLIAARDQAEEMSRLKSAFLANMSHEIRTPLTAIIGFSSMIERTATDQSKEFARRIASGGRRLLNTLNSVLDLAQLEGGSVTLHPETLDVSTHLEETVELYREEAAAKSLDLLLQIEPGDPAITVDASAFHRVMNNLVHNAVKFTRRGQVAITCMPSESSVTIHVSDTGVGIDPAFQKRLFDDFAQESTGERRRFEGSGLGLAITRRLLDLMGGRIEVDSVQGEGTRFSVTLPR